MRVRVPYAVEVEMGVRSERMWDQGERDALVNKIIVIAARGLES